jgi:hypothetical protein
MARQMIVNLSRGERGGGPLAFVLLAACACGGASTVKATQGQWDEARAIAERYADQKHHFPADKVRAANPRLPFLFDAALPGASWVLVHDGRVVEGGGLADLGAYLDAIDVYADHALTTDDVTDLLYVFEALPPVPPEAVSPTSYVTDEDGELAARASWHGHELDVRLAYILRYASPSDVVSEDTSETWEMPVSFWTLHLRKGAVPTWTEERRELTRKREHIDED